MYFSCLPTAKPPTENDLTDILNTVSSEWRRIGNMVGLSGGQLNGFATRALNDDFQCCLAVFAHWINNGGTLKYPHSWRGLYALLCAVGHRGTAITVIKNL
jgi:hypothetical protein